MQVSKVCQNLKLSHYTLKRSHYPHLYLVPLCSKYAGIICQGLTCVEGSDILNVPVNVDDEYWVARLTVY